MEALAQRRHKDEPVGVAPEASKRLVVVGLLDFVPNVLFCV
jgi:hypothetical protein